MKVVSPGGVDVIIVSGGLEDALDVPGDLDLVVVSGD